MGDGFAGPLDEGLPEEARGDEAPVGPTPIAAALDHRSNACAFLHGGRVGEALSVFAEGGDVLPFGPFVDRLPAPFHIVREALST